MRLIGLSGYARAGKDTVGEILVRDHGFTRVSFADKLREAALAIDPILWTWVPPGKERVAVRLSTVIDIHGWEYCKENYPEVRRLLQALGTEAGRNILGENIWVTAAFKGLDPDGKYVFTDVRFPNEYHAIGSWGGEVWRVSRPDTAPVNAHPSETALDDGFYFHRYVHNNSTIKSLEVAVGGFHNAFEAVQRARVVPDVSGRDVSNFQSEAYRVRPGQDCDGDGYRVGG